MGRPYEIREATEADVPALVNMRLLLQAHIEQGTPVFLTATAECSKVAQMLPVDRNPQPRILH